MSSDSPASVLADDEEPGIPHLSDPPIEEVVCGLVFPAVPEFDALEQGIYWDLVADRFPHKQIQPVLLDGGQGMLVQGVAPIRSWLISECGDILVQIQQDRFYMNWRRHEAAYPRFRDHGDEQGLCSRALDEFDVFREFLHERFGESPQPTRVELQKQDLLLRSKHWSDLRDVSKILPVVSTFAEVQSTDHAGFNLRMVEPDNLGTTTLQIATRMDSEHTPDAIRLDFHCSATLHGADVRACFHAANARLNCVFKRLFTGEAWPRFGGQDDKS